LSGMMNKKAALRQEERLDKNQNTWLIILNGNQAPQQSQLVAGKIFAVVKFTGVQRKCVRAGGRVILPLKLSHSQKICLAWTHLSLALVASGNAKSGN